MTYLENIDRLEGIHISCAHGGWFPYDEFTKPLAEYFKKCTHDYKMGIEEY